MDFPSVLVLFFFGVALVKQNVCSLVREVVSAPRQAAIAFSLPFRNLRRSCVSFVVSDGTSLPNLLCELSPTFGSACAGIFFSAQAETGAAHVRLWPSFGFNIRLL